MNDEEFRLHQRIEEGHWWFVGKRLILGSLLGDARVPAGGNGACPDARMLDLGCGTGGVLREWTGRARCVGIDRSALALQICAEKGFTNLARGDLGRLPFRDGAFDTVLLLDVIEHLADDVAFLRRAASLCAPGGRVVISVPAFQLLWSKHDESFEHFRRYTARGLERAVREAGLVPERTTYTNCLLFPVALVWRLLSYRVGLGRFAPRTDFWPLPGWMNALLRRLYVAEARMLRRADLPFGVSVVCIARSGDAPRDRRRKRARDR